MFLKLVSLFLENWFYEVKNRLFYGEVGEK